MRKMQILDCKACAEKILHECREEIERNALHPVLAVISVGDDEASKIYLRNKQTTCEAVGIEVRSYHYGTVTQKELEQVIEGLNKDENVHGIMVQLPLPEGLNPAVAEKIAPEKDVDGLTPASCFAPCTPDGIMRLLEDYGVTLAGKHAVVVGRSKLVGKPMANMLMDAGATVTVCNSKTMNLGWYTEDADILVCAAGHPKLITAEMVRSGAVVIDVGINRVNGKVCGDVDAEDLENAPVWLTKVPGGVGKLTVAMVAEHTVKACLRLKKTEPSF